MTLQTTGAISISDLKNEFGGPNDLGEYYRGGSYVPNIGQNGSIPTSGSISLSQFYGATGAVSGSWDSGTPGDHQITVPRFNWITFQVYGAGGGGGSAYNYGSNWGNGGGTSFIKDVNGNVYLWASGGGGGQGAGTGTGGGGSEGGGNQNNTDGGAGQATNAQYQNGVWVWYGGNGGNGGCGSIGGGGNASGGGADGAWPSAGGGGGGFWTQSIPYGGSGGGGGAYTQSTYYAGQIPIGMVLNIGIGAGGSPGTVFQDVCDGGWGANGRVTVTWG